MRFELIIRGRAGNMTNTRDGGVRVALSGSPRLLSPLPQLPKAPSPSRDPGVTPDIDAPIKDLENLKISKEIDIFELAPTAALKMLCDTIEALVCLTGDVPPTPPLTQTNAPNLGLMQAEKDNVARHLRERHHSRQNSASSLQDLQHSRQGSVSSLQEARHSQQRSTSFRPGSSRGANIGEESLQSSKDPIGSPEARPTEPVYVIDSTTESSLNLQHGFIVRKFYSKKPPPIPLEEYLLRVHQFCPMSTAVYLATSLYIHRLAVVERIIPVTARNAHRLVLAGLRVSMKKLEDQKYGHSRFARVGGVSEAELGKLEVSFCFLTSFDLKANQQLLTEHAEAVRDGTALVLKEPNFQPVLPALKDKRRMLNGKGKPMEVIKAEAPAAA